MKDVSKMIDFFYWCNNLVLLYPPILFVVQYRYVVPGRKQSLNARGVPPGSTVLYGTQAVYSTALFNIARASMNDISS